MREGGVFVSRGAKGPSLAAALCSRPPARGGGGGGRGAGGRAAKREGGVASCGGKAPSHSAALFSRPRARGGEDSEPLPPVFAGRVARVGWPKAKRGDAAALVGRAARARMRFTSFDTGAASRARFAEGKNERG